MIPDDNALQAAERLRHALPLLAAHRFDDGIDSTEPDIGPLTKQERLLRNAAAARAWHARQLDAARAHGMTVDAYRAMVRTNTKDSTPG